MTGLESKLMPFTKTTIDNKRAYLIFDGPEGIGNYIVGLLDELGENIEEERYEDNFSLKKKVFWFKKDVENAKNLFESKIISQVSPLLDKYGYNQSNHF